ncbi:MAG: hypothetical protein EPGJADBJ_04424 [Saprospiraceae bacterium]|nr:hypothetical protein [Saprospiraceae bacterium]
MGVAGDAQDSIVKNSARTGSFQFEVALAHLQGWAVHYQNCSGGLQQQVGIFHIYRSCARNADFLRHIARCDGREQGSPIDGTRSHHIVVKSGRRRTLRIRVGRAAQWIVVHSYNFVAGRGTTVRIRDNQSQSEVAGSARIHRNILGIRCAVDRAVAGNAPCIGGSSRRAKHVTVAVCANSRITGYIARRKRIHRNRFVAGGRTIIRICNDQCKRETAGRACIHRHVLGI